MGRQERRHKQLLDDLKVMRGWKLKNEALYRTVENSFGRGFGLVVRQTAE